MRSIRSILIFVLFASCTSNTIYKKPDDLIPEDQMVNILVDMYIANAAKNIKTKDVPRKVNYQALIYKKYGIDSLRFHNSNVYYMSRIDDYEAIYKKATSRIINLRDSVEAIKKNRDSIQAFKVKEMHVKKKEVLKKRQITKN